MIYVIQGSSGCDGSCIIELLKSDNPQNMKALKDEYFGVSEMTTETGRVEIVSRHSFWFEDVEAFTRWLVENKGFVLADRKTDCDIITFHGSFNNG